MSNFTPGPWEARWEKKGKRYRIFNRHLLCLGEVYYIGEEGRHGDGEANARLIAAAPEMKDRLKEAKECLIYLTPWWEDDLERIEGVIDSINALLRRIEGKEAPK